MKKLKILVTNDDGIYSTGIRFLYDAVASFADVTVVAPKVEQSGTSVGITIRTPLRVEEHTWPGDVQVWSVDGTPADCIKLALHTVLNDPPDLIVSGINRGNNAGRTVVYSGTVAAVIEGVLHGIPGIAFSCRDYFHPNYEEAAQLIPKLVQFAVDHPLPQGTFLNVNFPSPKHGEFQGIQLTRQGKQFLLENPEERFHPAEQSRYYWLGIKVARYEEEDTSDIYWLEKGYVAVAPIHISDLTDDGYITHHRMQFQQVFSQAHDKEKQS